MKEGRFIVVSVVNEEEDDPETVATDCRDLNVLVMGPSSIKLWNLENRKSAGSGGRTGGKDS
jgi:hypothetical protein